MKDRIIGATLIVATALVFTWAIVAKIDAMPLQASAPVQLTGQLNQGSDYQLQDSNYLVQGGTGIK